MIHASGMGWVLATGAALSLHLLLFVAVVPSRGHSSDRSAAPPLTRYLPASAGETVKTESDVRRVRSPVLFSLPSSIGFTQELLNNDVRTKLSFLQPVETEQFLEVAAGPQYSGKRLAPLELRISSRERTLPLPIDPVDRAAPRRAATRVVLAPELKSRLVGGIVLPPELNGPVETPWEVHASISVSEQGAVRHILLEQPLDAPERNQQVLRLLYGLRFKAGKPVESSIDIYSPETEGGLVR
jgi:hypothetical protein